MSALKKVAPAPANNPGHAAPGSKSEERAQHNTRSAAESERSVEQPRSAPDFSGHILVPRNYWGFIPAGSRVRMVFRDKARVGGYFRGMGMLGDKEVVVLCRMPEDLDHQVAVPAARISQLWKLLPADLEMRMLMDSLTAHRAATSAELSSAAIKIAELAAKVTELSTRSVVQIPSPPANVSVSGEGRGPRPRSTQIHDSLGDIIARR